MPEVLRYKGPLGRARHLLPAATGAAVALISAVVLQAWVTDSGPWAAIIAGLLAALTATVISLAQAAQLRSVLLQAVEARLATTIAELEASNADLQHFAAVAAHDLRSPLTTVSGFANLLATGHGGELNDEGKVWTHAVVHGVSRMRALIDGLFAYSQVGTAKRGDEEVKLGDVVGDVCADLRNDIETSGTTVHVGELPEVVGDAMQLRQLFQNLISNAVRFSSPDRPLEVRVSASRVSDGWLIEVADNGIGIPVEQREHIFDIFRRGDQVRDRLGAGIGLAICRRVVERHGGRIWMDDAPGGGTTCRFTLSDSIRPDSESYS